MLRLRDLSGREWLGTDTSLESPIGPCEVPPGAQVQALTTGRTTRHLAGGHRATGIGEAIPGNQLGRLHKRSR